MLDVKLDTLKKKIIEFGDLVEEMISKSLAGYLQNKREFLDDVMYVYEPKSNQFELDIDELCTTMIAQFDPKAVDLRTVLMILKMGADFERMADHAVNISESGIYLVENPLKDNSDIIEKMGEICSYMLRDSIDAFISGNSELAKKVCDTDNEVDELRKDIIRKMIPVMAKDSVDIVEKGLHVLRISSNLERIADLSTNICEDIIFMVKGKTIKHSGN